MSTQIETHVVIQRRPLNTSPAARLNSYNHHALAPWLEETGYLTPLFLHKREEEISPFNMGRWLTPAISEHMLQRPVSTHPLSEAEVERLLEAASEVQYDIQKAMRNENIRILGDEMQATTTAFNQESVDGYFIRMSHCSPKDADGGNLEPVFSMRDALVKLVSSKRTVRALLSLYEQYRSGSDVVDNQLYFFPYFTKLDRLSEWRCYINNNRVVAISQSRFHQCNRSGITDEALKSLAAKVHRLWYNITTELKFDSCILDVYAEVQQPVFEVKLIEVNPWGAHSGSGSLLFHWLDDGHLLERHSVGDPTVIRLVEAGDSPVLSRNEAFGIGRDGIVDNELRCLRERGLEWVLEDQAHSKFMALPVPDGHLGAVTRRDALETFMLRKSGERGPTVARNHPRFVKLKKASTGFQTMV